MKTTGLKLLLAASLLAGTACTTDTRPSGAATSSPGVVRSQAVPGRVANPEAAGPAGFPRPTQMGTPGTQNPTMLGN